MDGLLGQLLPALGGRPALCKSVLPALLGCVADIADALRESHDIALAGSANMFGDDQLNVDIAAEELVRAALSKCPAVVTASSEEDPVERPVAHSDFGAEPLEKYTMAFDPLDGSSIISSNWTVGTIVGIWDGESALRQPPARGQIAAILGVYGPRTTAIIALRIPGAAPACLEIGIGARGNYTILRPALRLASPPFKARYFAPANIRAAAEFQPYMRLLTQLVEGKYTMRYSGGLVPDLVHALVKGHGLYVSPVTDTSQAKLRRLYELYPAALVMECAGGRAVDPTSGEDILAQPLQHCDERAGLVCGTTEEVELAMCHLLCASAADEQQDRHSC